jgi:DNA anti-recombination protein RmuC
MLYNQERRILEEIEDLKRIIRHMATNTQAGLAALQQADTDLAAAVTANTAASQAVLTDIQTLTAELANNEDPAVQQLATDIAAKVAALQANTDALTAAVTPAAPPPAPTPAS